MRSSPKTKFFRLAFFTIAALPLLAMAQGGGGGWSGLVPCGNPGQLPCTFNDLLIMANGIVDFSFRFGVLPLVAIGVLASGITVLTAAGSEGQIKKGRDMLKNIVIGFIIASLAWVAVNTAVGALVRPGCNFLENAIGSCQLYQ